jgi:hypothetical protein
VTSGRGEDRGRREDDYGEGPYQLVHGHLLVPLDEP